MLEETFSTSPSTPSGKCKAPEAATPARRCPRGGKKHKKARGRTIPIVVQGDSEDDPVELGYFLAVNEFIPSILRRLQKNKVGRPTV